MHISRAEIHNYKSFYNSGPIELKPGFNVIVGPNNVGKTALLEALSLGAGADPHRTLRTVPYPGGGPVDQASSVDVWFTITREELREIVGREGAQFRVALPEPRSPFGNYDASESSGRDFMQRMMEQADFTFAMRYTLTGQQQGSWTVQKLPSCGLYRAQESPGQESESSLRIKYSSGDFRGMARGPAEEIGSLVARAVQTRVYRFTAERFNVAQGPFSDQSGLHANASNLPQVMNSLQGRNPERFRELNRLLHQVFPQIHTVSVRPAADQVEIIAWTVDPTSQREDLAIPLDKSGTGFGQVLAILYVVLTADRPHVILIDEPQSFLHPGAVRKLIDILKGYAKHQYIVATHSPAVITAASPSTITSVALTDGESTVIPIDAKLTADLQRCLGDVGARLSDVFGADNILWVEGKTEEICFPQILEKMAGRHLMGTAIVGLRSTGELEGRGAELVLDIYDRLSTTSSLLPPAVGFIFDRECRTEQQRRDLERRSKGRAKFIPRRMYENYLLHPQALADVVNRIEGFRSPPVTPEEVEQSIERKRSDPKLFCKGDDPGGADWVNRIDGAKMLEGIFSALSESRVVFRKVEHSVAITEWLLSHEPRNLQEIADLLAETLTTDALAV